MADLTTKAKIKDFLGVTSSANDSQFTLLAENVSLAIERYCNRTFVRGTYTEYFDTQQGDQYVFLRNHPIISVTSVKYRTGSWGSPTWTALPADDYMLVNDAGKIRFAGVLPEADKYIQVVYVGGYLIDFTTEGAVTHTLPGDLEQIATEWAARVYQMRKSGGILSESTEGQSITFKTEKVAKEFLERLDAYRNIKI